MYSSASSNISLDKEYSPSLNTKRFQEFPNPNEYLMDNFIKVTAKETARVSDRYQMRTNIRYGSVDGSADDNQILDIYYKLKEYDTPIFVFIHGGYWQYLDKTTAGSFVAPLVENGYRVVVVDYNLCPRVTLEQLTEQMLNFYDWLFQYAKETNASKIVFCGHSAGAHLAILLLSSSYSKIFCMYPTMSYTFFLISGLYDLRELWNLESANPKNILGLSANTAIELSPICANLDTNLIEFCKNNNVSINVLAAENDSETFIGQSREYAKKLIEAGLQVELKIFKNYDHFDIIEEAANEKSAITQYILENLN